MLLANIDPTATAKAVEVTGGMSLLNGDLITAIFTGIAAVVGALGVVMWGKRKGAVARPVDSDDRYVTQLECKNYRCAIERHLDGLGKRLDELGPALNRIFKKLNENDARSEERANQMHRRIDPLIERTAANSQAIEMLRANATQKGDK